MPDDPMEMQRESARYRAKWTIQRGIARRACWETDGSVEVECSDDQRHRLPDLLRALARELEAQFAERGEGLK